MKSDTFWYNRRQALRLLGGAFSAPVLARQSRAAPPPIFDLRARETTVDLRPGSSQAPVWSVESASGRSPGFKAGEIPEVSLLNELSAPISLSFRGLDGANQVEALLRQPPVGPGSRSKTTLALRRPGTYFADIRTLGDGAAKSSALWPFVVAEDSEPQADRDEIFLIEDWRLDAGGNALAPGKDAGNAAAIYTVNRKPDAEITLPRNARLRLRIINGCQRAIVALKIADLDVRVMAIDSQPAEPFLARNGQLLMAPGSRVDAFIDATGPAGSSFAISLFDGVKPASLGRIAISSDAPIRPSALSAPQAFSSAGLPPRIELQNAMRADVTLGAQAPWAAPAVFTAATKPAFQVKRGRNVVLALKNASATPGTFHLHGHHFRLLDRLDDGWKPFWLDTLAFDANQIQRIAFVADYAGQWLMEFMPVEWSSQRRVQSYTVE